MSNELFQPETQIDPSKLPPDQQAAFYLQAANVALLKQVEAVNRELQMHISEQEQKNEAIAEGLRKVADASSKRLKHADKYYVRTVIGKVFVPEISAQRMTKLLRVVGVCGVHGEPLAPFRSGAEPLAKLKPNTEYPTWMFHADKLMKRIDRWLQENEWYLDFHNTTTKEERDSFIDMLFEEYVQ